MTLKDEVSYVRPRMKISEVRELVDVLNRIERYVGLLKEDEREAYFEQLYTWRQRLELANLKRARCGYPPI